MYASQGLRNATIEQPQPIPPRSDTITAAAHTGECPEFGRPATFREWPAFIAGRATPTSRTSREATRAEQPKRAAGPGHAEFDRMNARHYTDLTPMDNPHSPGIARKLRKD
jgi:hypothetical protein